MTKEEFARRLANACRLTEQELDDMWRLQKEEAE